jgi:hypothetical protein
MFAIGPAEYIMLLLHLRTLVYHHGTYSVLACGTVAAVSALKGSGSDPLLRGMPPRPSAEADMRWTIGMPQQRTKCPYFYLRPLLWDS